MVNGQTGETSKLVRRLEQRPVTAARSRTGAISDVPVQRGRQYVFSIGRKADMRHGRVVLIHQCLDALAGCRVPKPPARELDGSITFRRPFFGLLQATDDIGAVIC
jgi:hypothetical protein